MHVCHITLAHSPYDDRIYYKELWGLRDWADQISLIAPESPNMEVVYPEIQIFPFQLATRFQNLKQILQRAISLDAEIYHLHEVELLTIVPQLRKQTNAVFVYDMHEPLPEVIREFSPAFFPKRILVSVILRTLEYIGLGYVDGAIFTSKPLSQQNRWRIKNHTIIYNYPRLDLFKYTKKKIKTDFVILYQGQIAPARGIAELIQGFARFYDHTNAGHLRIIGIIDPPEFVQTLRNLISVYHLETVVSIEPQVPHSKMPQILSEASVGIMALLPTPAFKKSVQGKTFEYMASGLPVIAGNYPSAHQFIGETQSGIILKNTTPQTIAAAIEKLYSKPVYRNALGANGLQAVTERFNWQSMKTELQQFYSSILSEKA